MPGSAANGPRRPAAGWQWALLIGFIVMQWTLVVHAASHSPDEADATHACAVCLHAHGGDVGLPVQAGAGLPSGAFATPAAPIVSPRIALPAPVAHARAPPL